MYLMSTFLYARIWGKYRITVDNSGDSVDKGQQECP